ncbi:replication initiator protein [Capybara microvirus Cap3_SP_578]|nr:replication initiator protein [Capybara microvirus Cap3_SP_578]
MSCSNPLEAFLISTADGEKHIRFSLSQKNVSYDDFDKKSLITYDDLHFSSPVVDFKRMFLPCGKCSACKLDRSIQWSVRMIHESLCHSQNCFLTLTYDDNHLPADRLLCKRDVQLFIKRLRKVLYPLSIRYFLCGEYGTKFHRPHYHIVLFGYKPDKLDSDLTVRAGISEIFRSSYFENIWAKGHCYVGTVTQKSCAYVARYCTKKQDENFPHKEFILASNRPGIGAYYFDQHYKDFYTDDKVLLETDDINKPIRSFKVPRYYDKLLYKKDLSKYIQIKERRVKHYEDFDVNQFYSSLSYRKEVSRRAVDHLPRILED